MVCEYCRGTLGADSSKCQNCGAPTDMWRATGPDFRVCPHCTRRLISLGSPACNYCGRRLPDSYLQAREQTKRRIEEIESDSARPGTPAFDVSAAFAGDEKDDERSLSLRNIIKFLAR